MKRVFIFILAALLLTGCAAQREAVRPDWWQGDWFTVSDILAVVPWDVFRLDESNDVLSPNGLYYATWVSGEGRQIVSDTGRDATAYDVQVYLLVKECKDEAEVACNIDDWIGRESASYTIGKTVYRTLSDEHATQEYSILPLLESGEQNPYKTGAAAFAVRGNTAISVELLGNYDDNQQAIDALMQFLACIHYNTLDSTE